MSDYYAGWVVAAVVFLVMTTILLYGQPAAREAEAAKVSAQATEITWLRATISALPTPTPRHSLHRRDVVHRTASMLSA